MSQQLYLFDTDQLNALLINVIDMYDYLGKFQTLHDQAKPNAVREMLNQLDIERSLSSEDPAYIATQQIIPVMATIVPDPD